MTNQERDYFWNLIEGLDRRIMALEGMQGVRGPEQSLVGESRSDEQPDGAEGRGKQVGPLRRCRLHPPPHGPSRAKQRIRIPSAERLCGATRPYESPLTQSTHGNSERKSNIARYAGLRSHGWFAGLSADDAAGHFQPADIRADGYMSGRTQGLHDAGTGDERPHGGSGGRKGNRRRESI